LKHCAGRSAGRSKRGAVQEWEALRGSGCSALRGAVQARGGSSAGRFKRGASCELRFCTGWRGGIARECVEATVTAKDGS
jgi:hypothetical protein